MRSPINIPPKMAPARTLARTAHESSSSIARGDATHLLHGIAPMASLPTHPMARSGRDIQNTSWRRPQKIGPLTLHPCPHGLANRATAPLIPDVLHARFLPFSRFPPRSVGSVVPKAPNAFYRFPGERPRPWNNVPAALEFFLFPSS